MSKIVVTNRKARFDYHIEDRIEAGLVLTGAEIKSIREGGMTLEQSYVRPHKGELFLIGAHIKQYGFADDKSYDPVRPRKLLLHKAEINKFRGKVESKGFTLVPLSIYLKEGKAKLELALAKGKSAPDKRQNIKEKESKRDLSRVMKNR